MFEQPVGHFLERHPHVFVGDLLSDDIERHGRKAGVHRPHDPRQNRAVADAGVEHPDRRGAGWMLASSSETRLAISVFSLQVETNRRYFCLLSKKRKPGGAVSGCGSRRGGAHEAGQARRLWRGLRRGPAHGQKGADLLECFRGDPRPVAKPRDELSVVDDAPSESQFRGPRFAAEIPDLAEDLLVRRRSRAGAGEFRDSWPNSAFPPRPKVKRRTLVVSTTIRVGGRSGQAPTLVGRDVGASPLAYAMEGQSAAP